jgi:hypothetical protein
MAKQTINLGNTVNDGTGDALRVGAQKINANFTELYNLLGGNNIQIVSSITAGPGLVASSSSGEVTITAQPASADTVGVVKIGTGITVSGDGTISSPVYTLPRAATNILGGIKVGNNLTIDNEGVLSADAQNYVLPTASPSTKGGIKIGSGLEIEDDVLSVVPGIASSLQDGTTSMFLIDLPEISHSLLQSTSGVSISTTGITNFTGLIWSDEETAVNQIYVNALGTTILNQNSNTNTQWRFRADGILAGPTIAIGTLNDQTQIIALDNEENITFGNYDLKSYIRIESPTAPNEALVRHVIRINSNNLDDFVEGLGHTSPGGIELNAGAIHSETRSSLRMGTVVVDNSHDFPPTGTPTKTLTTNMEISEGCAFYGDVYVTVGDLGIRTGIVFQDGTYQTTAYQGESPAEITIDRLTNGENEIILDTSGVLTVVGTIYSNSNVSLESITDTSITAGTDLKLFADGLFALRNYSLSDGIAIIVNYNDATQKSWLFGNEGSITFPDNTIQTTAFSSTYDSISTSSNSITIDFSHSLVEITLNQSINNINFINTPGTESVKSTTVVFIQDASGNRTVSGSGYLTQSGVGLQISALANSISVINFTAYGSTIIGFNVGQEYQ